MALQTEWWQIGLAVISLPITGAAIGRFFLGGKKTQDVTDKKIETSSAVDIVDAATRGYDKAMSGTASVTEQLVKVLNEMGTIRAEVESLRTEVANLKKQIAEKDDTIAAKDKKMHEYSKKVMLLSRIAVRLNNEGREKDTVLRALTRLIIAKDGEVLNEAAIKEAQLTLSEFAKKIQSAATSDQMNAYMDALEKQMHGIEATILSEEADMILQVKEVLNEFVPNADS